MSGLTVGSEHEARVAEAHELSELLVRAADRAKADFAEAAAAHDLPVPVARALVQLAEPAPMRELADRLACDRSYVTGLADQLETRGLVERTPGRDRRTKLLALTARGTSIRDALIEALAHGSLVTRTLDDAERRALRPLLTALVAD